MHCLSRLLIFSAAASACSLRRDTTNNNAASVLRNSQGNFSHNAIVSFPGQPQFENATIRWNSYDAPSYDAAISPATEQDVVAAVNLLRSHNLSFLATGGRHGYGGEYGRLQDGVALDLAQMNQVTVNSTARTVTVGPGVHFRDIYNPVWNAGFIVPTGTCSCVGMIGATLGAGIGRLQGTLGLMIDALESVRLVTAAGQVLTVSNTSYPELFWGIRGAGANFGVITAATYRLSPRKTILSGDFIYPASANASYFDMVSKLVLPPEEAVLTLVVWNETVGAAQIHSSVTYVGTSNTSDPFAPFLALRPTFRNTSALPWNRLASDGNFGLDAANCVREEAHAIHPVNLRAFNASTHADVFARFAALYAARPDLRGSVITLETWPNQAVVAVPDNTTAYPWRDTTTYVMLQMLWDDPDNRTRADAANAAAVALQREYVATSGYADLAVYMNYARGDETLEELYGRRKLGRLAALKKTYDPQNLFRWGIALPTTYRG